MRNHSMIERLPLAVGAVAGLAAWAFVYLFTYLLTAADIRSSPARKVFEFFGGDLPTWKMVGWVFFNAHFVDTVFEGLFGGSRNFVGGDGFTPFLFIVPPLLLVVAGVAIGRYAGVDELETGQAAFVGATVATGYVVLSVAGAVLFSIEGAGPDTITAVLLAGLVYPLVFGAAGALVARATEG